MHVRRTPLFNRVHFLENGRHIGKEASYTDGTIQEATFRFN